MRIPAIVLLALVLGPLATAEKKPKPPKVLQPDITEGCVTVHVVNYWRGNGSVEARLESSCNDVMLVTLFAAYYNKQGEQDGSAVLVLTVAPNAKMHVFVFEPDDPNKLFCSKTGKIVKVGVGPVTAVSVSTPQ